jgi:peptidoglycan lytic transglycosylase
VRRHSIALLAASVLALRVGASAQNPITPVALPVTPAAVAPTKHPPVPSLYWLVPDSALSRSSSASAPTSADARLAKGAMLIGSGDYAAGLDLVRGAEPTSPALADYRRYYIAVALIGLQRVEEATAVLGSISDDVKGYLAEGAALRKAEVAEARGDADKAADILEHLGHEKTLTPREQIYLRLATVLDVAGERDEALKAYSRVYYEFPLSTEAAAAQDGIERLQTPALIPPDRFRLELDRAERLFSAKRWAQARPAFVTLARAAGSDDRELIDLRIAECDYYLGRYAASRDGVRPYLRGTAREAEARFFYLTAMRALGDFQSYVSLAQDLVSDHGDSAWAEETLNNLALHYVDRDDDESADRVFRELARRFPKGRYAERAAWRTGWWAYKTGRYADTAEIFEAAAVTFPRADYRPSWLYWAARSRDRLGDRGTANALYRIVAADYLNSYYGRLASAILTSRQDAAVPKNVSIETVAKAPGALVATDALIRALVVAGMYDDALNEVEYARQAWGDSSPLQATAAWIRHRRGLQDGASARFADVRGAITTMRRAYPQFMAAGGEQLPADLLRVIFPLDYWPLIKKYSDTYKLDPYLMTALIAQESTFTSDVRSSANAVGLMQLIPPTARRYAKKIGVPYSARVLTQPETNIRLGMRYFKDLVDRFGSPHLALAGYNAGENRVSQWLGERPRFEQDEFIDDIPFPETQNYVKRILGTADDYRRLYGGGTLSVTTAARR